MKKASMLIIFVVAAVSLFLVQTVMSSDRVLRTSDGQIISFERMMQEVQGINILLVGEIHDNEEHHRIQLKVIEDLQQEKHRLSVGLEMFPVEAQKGLDAWVDGMMDRRSFIKLYYQHWQLPWTLYRDIFLFARQHSIPLVALNVSRDVTKRVAEGGFASLTPEEKSKLPPGITCNVDPAYRAFIKEVYTQHGMGMSDKAFTYFCEAQMVWDQAMAQHVSDYMSRNNETVMVVIVGGGHAMKRGIPRHIASAPYSFRVIMPQTGGESSRNDADYIVLK